MRKADIWTLIQILLYLDNVTHAIAVEACLICYDQFVFASLFKFIKRKDPAFIIDRYEFKVTAVY